eukprot:TRINITY_DN708_c0_g1_i3.p1 TRINITY_DN708_c0_g1~~TRINITY_DN708_c0_g1_i3.p1  ORF type:complete len:482 (-),score=110.69 TRINITY_DN708_c0_g1_i3:43-1488(-)
MELKLFPMVFCFTVANLLTQQQDDGDTFYDASSEFGDNRSSFIKNITRVAGTSAGSITATCLAIGFDTTQMIQMMKQTDFTMFQDGTLSNISNFLRKGYLNSGAGYEEYLKALFNNTDYVKFDKITFNQQQHSEYERTYQQYQFTFQDLLLEKDVDLHIFTVRVNDGDLFDCCAKNTPNMQVALALRMSMAIPVFFSPVEVYEIRPRDEDGHISKYCNGSLNIVRVDENPDLPELNDKAYSVVRTYFTDGGIKANYPFSQIKEEYNIEDRNILGFKVDSQSELIRTQALQDGDLTNYYDNIKFELDEEDATTFKTMLGKFLKVANSTQNDSFYDSLDVIRRTIQCFDENISTTKFELTEYDQTQLLSSGLNATKIWFYENLNADYDVKISWKDQDDQGITIVRREKPLYASNMETHQPLGYLGSNVGISPLVQTFVHNENFKEDVDGDWMQEIDFDIFHPHLHHQEERNKYQEFWSDFSGL